MPARRRPCLANARSPEIKVSLGTNTSCHIESAAGGIKRILSICSAPPWSHVEGTMDGLTNLDSCIAATVRMPEGRTQLLKTLPGRHQIGQQASSNRHTAMSDD